MVGRYSSGIFGFKEKKHSNTAKGQELSVLCLGCLEGTEGPEGTESELDLSEEGAARTDTTLCSVTLSSFILIGLFCLLMCMSLSTSACLWSVKTSESDCSMTTF